MTYSGIEVVIIITMLAVLLICYGDESICRKSTRPKFSEIQEKQPVSKKYLTRIIKQYMHGMMGTK